MDNASCVIVGVEATVASSSQEVISARKMLADCVERFGLAPKTLAADAGYGKADFLTWLENRRITPYIPLRLHYPSGNKLYGLDHFTYQPEANSFECPEGKELKYRGIKPAANRIHIYRSTEAQCRGCSKKAECTSGRYKQLVIHVDEEVRQRARLRNQEPDFFRHQRSRKKIEALFGELKNRICLRRARLRRLKYVREQFLMAATAQNLKRLVRFLASMPPDQETKNQLRIKSALRSHRPLERCWIGIAVRLRRRVFQQLLLSGHLISPENKGAFSARERGADHMSSPGSQGRTKRISSPGFAELDVLVQRLGGTIGSTMPVATTSLTL